ncbi:cellulase family glycosylhydrolase [Pseudomonas oryzihabitans]|uniref:cellulase family glycosylhydrolase n=1 Tax=Pseudomonas oryzihabitans TaxID=47885 RepID=UPI003F96CFAD
MTFLNSSLRNLIRSLALTLACGAAAPLAVAEQVHLVGLNLSGAGFAPQVLPGINGTHYIFPVEGYFSQWSARGVKLVRFPILWERLQPTLGGALDPTYASLIDRTFGYAQKYGMQIILDLHNYMKYRGTVIGTGGVSYAHYQDVMTRIAQRWSGQSSLYAYDLMNEPHDAVEQWPVAAQRGIDGIRTIDRVRPIMVEGNGWAEAARWPLWNDSLLALKDPANNLIFQAHVYFDGDGGGGNYANASSGTTSEDYGVERVKPFIQWLKKNGKRGMIGEFGVPDSDPRWNIIMGRMLAYLKQNCIPATYWAAGPGWGNYNLSVEPINGIERPQWSTLKAYLDDRSCTAIGPQTTSNLPNSDPMAANLVASAYQDYLGRAPDQAGLNYWSGEIASGRMSLAGVINALMASPEYQARATVDRLYQSYLGRSADAGGLSYWSAQLSSGGMSTAALVNALRKSEEYQSKVRSSIDQLYSAQLGRGADAGGLNYWTQQIVDGGLSLSDVKTALLQSGEYRTRVQLQIRELYHSYLGREADSEGLQAWTSQVTSGAMTVADVAYAIQQSSEYRKRNG